MGTMWGGSISLKTPLLFSVGFIAMFVIGGLSGIMHSIAPSDAQQQDTYFIVAHLHYVLFGGSIFAIFSGIYYWFPKATGRMLSDKIGQVHFWLTLIGFNIAFFPMHFVGMDGMPRRQVTYDASMGWEFWNLISTIGSFVIVLSVIVFLHNFFRSLRRGEIAGNDPWDGRTLEWSISSPPPEYNFATIPVVHSRDDFWEKKQSAGTSIPAGVSDENDEGHGIHMPTPSYIPIIVALGLFLAAYGLIYHFAAAIVGSTITMVGVYAWAMEPATEPTED